MFQNNAKKTFQWEFYLEFIKIGKSKKPAFFPHFIDIMLSRIKYAQISSHLIYSQFIFIESFIYFFCALFYL